MKSKEGDDSQFVEIEKKKKKGISSRKNKLYKRYII